MGMEDGTENAGTTTGLTAKRVLGAIWDGVQRRTPAQIEALKEAEAKMPNGKLLDGWVNGSGVLQRATPTSPGSAAVKFLTSIGLVSRDGSARKAIDGAQAKAKETEVAARDVIERAQLKAQMGAWPGPVGKQAPAPPVAVGNPGATAFPVRTGQVSSAPLSDSQIPDAAARVGPGEDPAVIAALEAQYGPKDLPPAAKGESPRVGGGMDSASSGRGVFGADTYQRALAQIKGNDQTAPALADSFKHAKAADSRVAGQVVDHANKHAAGLTGVKLDEPHRQVVASAPAHEFPMP